MFEVPRPIKDTNPLQWVIDIFDDGGSITGTRECKAVEKDYLNLYPANGFDAWAEKERLDNRRILEMIDSKYGYTPGIWRGSENKYAVKQN